MSATPCPAPRGEAEKPAPLALADLVAAGQVTHEMICDPAALGAEAPALNRLCALIGGEIYRIGPFHYAFRAQSEDMDGALGLIPFDDWTGMIEAALRAELGVEAVWLYPTDLLADACALDGAGTPATAPDQACAPAPDQVAAETAAEAAGETTGETAEAGNPSGISRALVDRILGEITPALAAAATEAACAAARDAAMEAAMEAARAVTAEALAAATRAAEEAVSQAVSEAEASAARPIEAVGLRLAEVEARLAGLETGLSPLLARLETLLARLDAGETRDDLLGEHLAEHLTLRLGGSLSDSLTQRAGAEAVFEETLGLALAEFLARVERAVAEPVSRPH